MPRFCESSGPALRRSLREIQQTFLRRTRQLRHVPYNLLDVEATRWHEDLASYRENIKDLSVFLENIIKQSLSSAEHTIRSYCRFLEAFSQISVKPSIKRVIQKGRNDLIRMLSENIASIKAEFEAKQKTGWPSSFVRSPVIPARIGLAMWTRTLASELQEKFQMVGPWLGKNWREAHSEAANASPQMLEEMERIIAEREFRKTNIQTSDIQQTIFSPRSPRKLAQARAAGNEVYSRYLSDIASLLSLNNEAREVILSYTQVSILLESYVQRQLSEWLAEADRYNMQELLSMPILSVQDTAETESFVSQSALLDNEEMFHQKKLPLLRIRFSPAVIKLARGGIYWIRLGFDLPHAIKDSVFCGRSYHEKRLSVNSIVRDYNNVISLLKEGESELFSDRLNHLITVLKPGIDSLTWDSPSLTRFITRVRQGTVELTSTIQDFHTTQKTIESLCNSILRLKLFQIKSSSQDLGSLIAPDTFKTNQTLQISDNAVQISRTHKRILEHLSRSFEGFRRGKDLVQARWAEYVRKVDENFENAIKVMIKTSLESLSLIINGRLRPVLEKESTTIREKADAAGASPIMEEKGQDVDMEGATGTNKVDISPYFRLSVSLSQLGVTVFPSIKELANLIRSVIEDAFEMISKFRRFGDSLKSVEEIAREKKAEETRKANEMRINQREREGIITSNSELEAMRLAVEEWLNLPLPPYSMIPPLMETIRHDTTISELINFIIFGVQGVEPEIGKSLQKWQPHAHLWEKNKQETFREFTFQGPTIGDFESNIRSYMEIQNDVLAEDSISVIQFIQLECSPLKQELVGHCVEWQTGYSTLLNDIGYKDLIDIQNSMNEFIKMLKVKPENVDQLAKQFITLEKSKDEIKQLREKLQPLQDKFKLLASLDAPVPENQLAELESLPSLLRVTEQTIDETERSLGKDKLVFREHLNTEQTNYNNAAQSFRTEFLDMAPFSSEFSPKDAIAKLVQIESQIQDLFGQGEDVAHGLSVFNVEMPQNRDLTLSMEQTTTLKHVWELIQGWNDQWDEWKVTQWTQLNVEEMEEKVRNYLLQLRKLGQDARRWDCGTSFQEKLDQFRRTMPLITDLKNPALRQRHWEQLSEEVGQLIVPTSKNFTLEVVLELNLDQFHEAISALSSSATQELGIENTLEKIATEWEAFTLDIDQYKSKGHYILRGSDDFFELLEDHSLTLSTMKGSRFVAAFEDVVEKWEHRLTFISEAVELVLSVQRAWIYLENIFIGSEDIRKQLPQESTVFEEVNSSWRLIMTKMFKVKRILPCMEERGVVDRLKTMLKKLDQIQKHLDDYLEVKRKIFPRFYFLSNDELLEILGQTRNPHAVQPHIKKCFDAIKKLQLEDVQQRTGRTTTSQVHANSMEAACGEIVPFEEAVLCQGAVEGWLLEIEKAMVSTIQKRLEDAILDMPQGSNREVWIKRHAGQICIAAGQVRWTKLVTDALSHENEESIKKGLKIARRKEVQVLSKLTEMVRKPHSKLVHKKIAAIITLEVHNRDVIERVYRAGCRSPEDFDWIAQLRYYWDPEDRLCKIKQTTTVFEYGGEYLGNNGRLVITPLTDRCYLTLTTALHLRRGGSPEGPAGTGKTETVKDLGKALAKMVIVFNCSEGLDYVSLGRMFSGLAQTGGWGCFDEFNRIEIEVLSVVAQQIMTILKAIAEEKRRFLFEGSTIDLDPTCGIFITMNPGYAGRTELPDNLKALFRPVAMMVPDYALICEIMLYSEGFNNARQLARKITTLYDLATLQLSKQPHYDFGLRAMRAVLVSSGTLKRRDPGANEDLQLFQTLKDSNIPKLVSQDTPLFSALLSDLFPGLSLPRRDYGALEKALNELIEEKKLQKVQNQIQKIWQLLETKATRHGVMVIGKTGSGKTTIYKLLSEIKTRVASEQEKQAMPEDNPERIFPVEMQLINPKALSLGELYGEFDQNTREWTDGIVSSLLRTFANAGTKSEKWIIFDGPVDTLWIESMNTVLDDSKVLTLINGERISFPDTVTFLFEAEDLTQASPATVSRCGMIYVDISDLGWEPLIQTWMDSKKDPRLDEEAFPNQIAALLEEYVQRILKKALEFRQRKCTELVPSTDIASVQMFMSLFDALATSDNCVNDHPENADMLPRIVEMYFLFTVIWSVGGSLDDQSRKKFDYFVREIDGQFPSHETVFEYNVDPQRKQWVKWEASIGQNWVPPPNVPPHKILVPTVDTIRLQYLLNKFFTKKSPSHCLIVGPSGVGKTAIINQTVLPEFESKHQYHTVSVGFSAQTSSLRAQAVVESRLEKRSKGGLAPPSNRPLIVFVDDINMPSKDVFGSQPPLELLRQFLDTGSWYNREKQILSNIRGVYLLAAMAPPGGGRNTISERFQSRFAHITLSFPSDSQLKRIFTTLLSWHFSDFDESVRSLVDSLTMAGLDIYRTVTTSLLPTPAKSHYVFNLRDLSKLFLGMMGSNSERQESRDSVVKLFVHESYRVFCDRLIEDKDREWFEKQLSSKLGSYFNMSINQIKVKGTLPLFVRFKEMMSSGRPLLTEETKPDELTRLIYSKLEEYRLEKNAVPMDLVLFRDCVNHICRVHRVLSQANGHVLLVGVGGSGRKSVARLAAYLTGMMTFEVEITKNYGLTEFREDIKSLFERAGMKNEPCVFLFSDTQCVNESFLEDINSLLSSGEVPNLYSAEELTIIREELRGTARDLGMSENLNSVIKLFYDRIRANLHIVLCMSPVGEEFRSRLRMFPSLVGNCVIDWFSEWPDDALREVALHFLEEMTLVEDNKDEDHHLKEMVADTIVETHSTALYVSSVMEQELNRKNYVTPTSYIGLVDNYKQLISSKRKELDMQLSKLQGGIDKLLETRQLVQDMSVELADKKIVVAQSQKECEELLVVIVQERRVADERASHVAAETEKLDIEKAEIQKMAQTAQHDLDIAMPALERARLALESLNKRDLSEIASFPSPPAAVQKLMNAVMVLLRAKPSWDESKRKLSQADFLQTLIQYDKDHVSEQVEKRVSKYVNDRDFTPEKVGRVSRAGKSLCMWVHAIYEYTQVFKVVKPMQDMVEKTQAALEEKMRALSQAKSELAKIMARIDELKARYSSAVAKKEKLRQESEELEIKLDRAAKLVTGLADERTRWTESIETLTENRSKIPGDCLLSAAFLSYSGPFLGRFRDLLIRKWRTSIRKNEIPASQSLVIQNYLATAPDIQKWQIQGLPSDSFSVDNGVLVTRAPRWPLFIDPQGQGVRWIKEYEKDNKMKVITFKMSDYVRQIESAVSFGIPVLIEDIGLEIDPILDQLLTRSIVRQGGQNVVKIGDKFVEYNPEFRLYLATKIGAPQYSPEICTKTTLVNFAVVEQGLKEQLLATVVSMERPELEDQKSSLVRSLASMTATIQELEDKILQMLSTASGSLLDDETLVDTLEKSKSTSSEITKKIKQSRETERKIDKARHAYEASARRAAQLFFVMMGLSQVDPMYQFSLDSYIQLFVISIDQSPTSEDLEERIEALNDYHTYAVYKYCCRGLFTRHKLLFSFQMCVKILMEDGKIDPEEYGFLLRGGVILDKSEQPSNPAPEWLPDSSWDDITALDRLPNFTNLIPQFEGRLKEWKKFYVSEKPETLPLVGELESNSNDLQRMIFIRCLRPDRISHAVSNFVSNSLGPRFIDPPQPDLTSAMADSSPSTPIIFVLSPGMDPAAMLRAYAHGRNMTERLEVLALGQGQAPKAVAAFHRALKSGGWLFLANAHLLLSWLPELEKLIASIPSSKPHKDFQLWISSDPHPKFPIGVLQASIKITTEPPSGIKANLARIYNSLDNDTLGTFAGNPKKDPPFRRLLFGLSFFHSILIERRKFLTLGFNIPYGFNDSDFQICSAILSMYIDIYTDIPWRALHYLIAEANYGGRVTDDWDRRVLRVYMSNIFCEQAAREDNYMLAPPLPEFYIPPNGNISAYKEYIQTLPIVDPPGVFGQHPNADIASQITESRQLLQTLLALQPRTASSEGLDRDSVVDALCSDLLKRLPPKIANLPPPVKDMSDEEAPQTTVLLQEADRYNSLLAMIRFELDAVQKGLKGLVVMSQHLDHIATNLANNIVPAGWNGVFLSNKPLAPWFRELIERIDLIQNWTNNGHPRVMWLGGLTFPTAYITALLQQAARKRGCAIDALRWRFEVTKAVDPLRDIKPSMLLGVGEGAYVMGTFIEGAGWDIDKAYIDEPKPMDLVTPMPIIHFQPVDAREKKRKGLYRCPCYYYPVRTGTREHPSFIIEVDLDAGQFPPEHWVKRGVALLLTLSN
eukprot:gnl/Chilomastix_cuspidata/4008.p1 GENE.gnl/Chilomastix_cuspidata/4008~~gnl/Chilomastix_cuspidata/4008.p1  ORF type:complete len:4809 (-),score=800.22 gnl/Chilomastix_cuspidata/4008:14-12793(-)